jgi:hypothetical protein
LYIPISRKAMTIRTPRNARTIATLLGDANQRDGNTAGKLAQSP